MRSFFPKKQAISLFIGLFAFLPMVSQAQWYTTIPNGIISNDNGNIGINAAPATSAFDLKLKTNTDFLRISRNASDGRAQLVLADQNKAEMWRIGMTAAGTDATYGTSFNIYDGANNVMTFTRNGHVFFPSTVHSVGIGIGYTTPAAKLHVGGNMIVGANDVITVKTAGGLSFNESNLTSKFNISTSNGNGARMTVMTSNGIAGGGIGVMEGNNLVSPMVWMYNAGSNAFTVARRSYGDGSIGSLQSQMEALFQVRSNGNVGIGTTNPQNKLSVNGTIWAQKVKVQLTDAADWVFADGYELMPLEKVDAYIREHKHLPDMPSAEEFRQNDMEVSDMSNRLLQKVEELTLHLIEQNKTNSELVKKIEELEKLVKSQQK